MQINWRTLIGVWSLLSLILGCTPSVDRPVVVMTLNSQSTDEQPALSGNGKFLAFVSNRQGKRQIMLYDLQQRRLINLPRLNRKNAIAQSPSLSYTGRYLVYIASDSGRPEIQLYDRKTGRLKIVTQGYRGWVRNPSISPDGRYILFESGRRGQWDIEVIDRGPNIELDLLPIQPTEDEV